MSRILKKSRQQYDIICTIYAWKDAHQNIVIFWDLGSCFIYFIMQFLFFSIIYNKHTLFFQKEFKKPSKISFKWKKEIVSFIAFLSRPFNAFHTPPLTYLRLLNFFKTNSLEISAFPELRRLVLVALGDHGLLASGDLETSIWRPPFTCL